MPPKILVSAGEASGDLYASQLVTALRRRHPEADFFGCAGPKLRDAGVRQVVNAASLAVVGLVEVVHHIPRIYGEFRKLVRKPKSESPIWRSSLTVPTSTFVLQPNYTASVFR